MKGVMRSMGAPVVAKLIFLLAATLFCNGQTNTHASAGSTSRRAAAQLPTDFYLYERFFQWVGAEDDRIQKETQEGKSAIAPGIDYGSAIGISEDRAQRMVALIVDAHHREASIDQAASEVDAKHEEDTSSDQGKLRPKKSVEEREQAKWHIFQNTFASIKQDLGSESFGKLDSYLQKEFTDGPFPLSSPPPTPKMTPTTFPLEVRYELLIRQAESEEEYVQHEAAEGKTNINRYSYSLAANFAPEEETPVRAILLNAWKKIEENTQQQRAAFGRMVETYGLPQATQMLRTGNAPEVLALSKHHNEIIDEAIADLKAELGENSFNSLDSWVSHKYHDGWMVTTSPTTPTASVQAP